MPDANRRARHALSSPLFLLVLCAGTADLRAQASIDANGSPATENADRTDVAPRRTDQQAIDRLTRAHEQEVSGLRFVLFGVVAATVATLSVGVFLLHRGRRRLLRANEELRREVERTERLQSERETLQRSVQQLERLDSIGLLAGGFAHDFNNILVAITGNAQLMMLENELDDTQIASLNQIVDASARAASLCKDILTYANATPRETEVVDLREVLRHVLPLARAGFSSGVRVEARHTDRALLVRGDQSQLEQVFLNLLVNAGDAVDGKGRITVLTDVQVLGGAPSNGYWFGDFAQQPRDCARVSVVDDGHGMTAETIQRVFDPFFSTRSQGRGMGLAASFGILRRHEGVVEIESRVGHGTRFTIYLPLAPLAENAPERAPVPEPEPSLPALPEGRAPATVLVVDDQPTVCQVARAALEIDGHRVLTAFRPRDALRLASRHGAEIEVALLDITMPEMDGPTLAGRLRQMLPDLRIVLMSGNADVQREHPELAVPPLEKPFDVHVLRQTILRQLATAP